MTTGGRIAVWGLAFVSLLAFTGAQLAFISRHTAVPALDQANYVAKTYEAMDVLAQARSLGLRGTVGALFATNPAHRAPLLPAVAALVLPRSAGSQAMAVVWLLGRLLALVTAVAVLSRLGWGPLVAPTALVAVLSLPSQLTPMWNIYGMDEPFECVGLLAFVLLVGDAERRTMATAAAATAGALLLCLVKPVAPVFLALGAAALLPLRPGWNDRWRLRLPCYLAGLALAGALAASPYGRGVAQFYDIGRLGYWRAPMSALQMLEMAASLVPPWLLGLAAVAALRGSGHGLGPRLVPAAVLLVGWYLFNGWLTYATEPRLMTAVTPVGVVAALAVLARRPRLAWAGFALSVGVLGLGLARLQGQEVPPEGPVVRALLGLPFVQHPVPEVGLRPAAEAMARQIEASAPGPDIPVVTVMCRTFLDCGAFRVAVREARGEWGRASFRQPPYGSAGFDLEALLLSPWFVTERGRRTVELQGDVWVTLEALHALFTRPDSPLRPYVEEHGRWPLQLPEQPDELTLWHVRAAPPPPVRVACLRFLRPQFRGTPGEAEFERRLAGREAGSTPAPAASPSGPGQAAPLNP